MFDSVPFQPSCPSCSLWLFRHKQNIHHGEHKGHEASQGQIILRPIDLAFFVCFVVVFVY
jgi:hypothetical protein